jgi:hypothetical protein
MSLAADVRRHLLKARMEIEAAQAKVEQDEAPEGVRLRIQMAQREASIAESLAAKWAES